MNRDKDVLKPDICVIGAGSGGLSVAAAAAAFGVSVVLIERSRMGGECLNTGCVPSKSLITAARHAQSARVAHQFGVKLAAPQTDWHAVHAHIRQVIDGIAPHDSVERFTTLGVNVIEAEGRFLDARTVEAGRRLICARHFVVATGSAPRIPDIPGLQDIPYLTNETLFEAPREIGHLLVLGGGAVGIEMAQAYRRLGAAVTLASRGELLSREDPELVAPIRMQLEAEGVSIHTYAEVSKAESGEGGRVRLVLKNGTRLEATHLLVATGRRPVLENLGLEKAGVAWEPDGIRVAKDLRTTNRRVYAIGDCVSGGERFTHVANAHAGLVIRSALFRLPVSIKPQLLPRTVYATPELAQIGLTESQARSQGLAPTILRIPFTENDRARTGLETEGLVKLVAGPRGRILGIGITGPEAGEQIALWSLALSKKLKLSDIAGTVLPYPTRAEAGKRAAVAYFAGAAKNPWLRRVLRILRVFG